MAGIDRIGQGYDLHRTAEGRRLVLGGVHVDYIIGLSGHSDADVVLHAVIDALLGGAGLGDIGQLFPDTDQAYKDADSGQLLKHVVEMVSQAGFYVVNLDLTIIAEKPKLQEYKPRIRKRIAELLNIETAMVNIKAKTNEGVDAVGRGEAMACWAIVGLGIMD